MKKKLEFTNDEFRVGQRALFEKVVEVINYNIDIESNDKASEDSVGIKELSEEEIKAPLWKKWKALSELKELDSSAKVKDVVEAYNALIKAINA